jgi:hypothetical protein
MNVLVACEFSGIVRDAFASKGHYAVSCDFLDTERDGNHYKGDIEDIIYDGWDMMIAFPPCTYLAVSGARWFKYRQKEQQDALEFVRFLMDAPIHQIAIENPVGVISTKIRKPDQIIQPWQFGHDASKKTCLWLKNLPKLESTKIIKKERYANQTPSGQNNLPPSKDRSKLRSLTYQGIADAMADQWG